MRVIKNQPLASTSQDVCGMPIPKDKLEEILQTMPRVIPLHQHHDRTLPVVGWIRDPRLGQLTTGEWAIVADVELHDSADDDAFGGFSISFAGNSYVHSDATETAVTVYLDTRCFTEKQIRDVASATTEGLGVSSRKLFRYAVLETTTTLIIIAVTFASVAFAKGFFGAMGKELWELLRSKLSMLTVEQVKHGRDVMYEFSFPVSDLGYHYEVIVRVPADRLWFASSPLVDIDKLTDYVRSFMDPTLISTVVAELHTRDPYLRILSTIPRTAGANGGTKPLPPEQ